MSEIKKEKSKLFKDNVNKRYSEAFAGKLLQAIKNGQQALTLELFKVNAPSPYGAIVNGKKRGDYCYGEHAKQPCEFRKSASHTEKRLCKCLFSLNHEPMVRECEKCKYTDRYVPEGFSVLEYEIPAYYLIDNTGGIDLILELKNEKDCWYATEVKPYSGNNESIIRMVSEILTYTQGFPNDHLTYLGGVTGKPYKKAIGFFEEAPQYEEWKNLYKNPNLEKLLTKAEITVFIFKRESLPKEENGTVIPGVISIRKAFPASSCSTGV